MTRVTKTLLAGLRAARRDGRASRKRNCATDAADWCGAASLRANIACGRAGGGEGGARTLDLGIMSAAL